MRRALLILALAMLSACTTVKPLTSPGGSPIDVRVAFTPIAGTFSAQIDSAGSYLPGAWSVALTPDTHEVSGTFQGTGFTISFSTISLSGGAEMKSIRQVSGPSAIVSDCFITYSSDRASSATPQSFKMTFRVTTNPVTACAGPPP